MRLAISLLILLFSLAASPAQKAQPKTKLYKGPWFDVRYPSDFKAKKGKTEDSAVFISPDGAVEFFVFSPLWNGDPKEIMLDAKKEKVGSEAREKKGDVVIYRATFVAKDGSYTRSVEDVENTGYNTRYTFGYKYRDKKAFDKYRQAYLNFKKSLMQYSD